MDKGLVCKIYEEPSKFNTLKKKQSYEKVGKRHEKTDMKRHSVKEHEQQRSTSEYDQHQ